jgi:hypothetical protein
MTTAASVDERLSHGETVWHWLHDNPDWDEYTLLFVSIHLDDGDVVVGLWEVWDQGTGSEDPVMFKSADPDRQPGEPTQWLRFATVAEALSDLSVHGVNADAFGSRDDLVVSYEGAVRARPATRLQGSSGPFAVAEMPDTEIPD